MSVHFTKKPAGLPKTAAPASGMAIEEKLELIRATRSTEVLEGLMKDSEREVRVDATERLGALLSRDPDPSKRQRAVTLTTSGTILGLLKRDDKEEIRIAALNRRAELFDGI